MDDEERQRSRELPRVSLRVRRTLEGNALPRLALGDDVRNRFFLCSATKNNPPSKGGRNTIGTCGAGEIAAKRLTTHVSTRAAVAASYRERLTKPPSSGGARFCNALARSLAFTLDGDVIDGSERPSSSRPVVRASRENHRRRHRDTSSLQRYPLGRLVEAGEAREESQFGGISGRLRATLAIISEVLINRAFAWLLLQPQRAACV